MENVVKELKKASGFSAYVIMNNDGIVIKYENMSYQTAVHHAALVLDLAEKSKKYNKCDLSLSEQAKKALCQYDWPGNIRELSHVIERAVLLSDDNEIEITGLTDQLIAGNNATNKGEMPFMTIDEA